MLVLLCTVVLKIRNNTAIALYNRRKSTGVIAEELSVRKDVGYNHRVQLKIVSLYFTPRPCTGRMD